MSNNDLDRKIPQIAKDVIELSKIREQILQQPTAHRIFIRDARDLSGVEDESVHLVVTSPPYWNLKKYNDGENQLGHINDYTQFLDQLDQVWTECFDKLVKGPACRAKNRDSETNIGTDEKISRPVL